jgi:hypothetical protein
MTILSVAFLGQLRGDVPERRWSASCIQTARKLQSGGGRRAVG